MGPFASAHWAVLRTQTDRNGSFRTKCVGALELPLRSKSGRSKKAANGNGEASDSFQQEASGNFRCEIERSFPCERQELKQIVGRGTGDNQYHGLALWKVGIRQLTIIDFTSNGYE